MKEKNMTGYAYIDKPQNIGSDFLQKNPVIPNMSIYSAINALSAFYKNEIAIDCLDLNVSYKQMQKDAISISLALKELGVKKGDIITVSMPNFYQAVATFLACNRIGAVTTFLNSYAPEEEIESYINTFESPVFINYDFNEQSNCKLMKKTNLKYIITLNKNKINTIDINSDYKVTSNDQLIDFNSLGSIAKFQKNKIELQSKKDDSLILFTSGTTGKPKSVVLTNENVLASGIYLKNSSRIKTNNDQRTLVCVPFSYPYGFGTSTLMSLLSGKTAILAPNISADSISYYMKKKPNIIFGSPALLDLIMKNISEQQDLSSINTFISGGDFLTPEANIRGKQFFLKHGSNAEIGNGSGNAETVSCGTNPVGINIRPETAGKILTGTEAIIVDPDTFEEKKYGEEGLLCVSGKHVFKEYYNDPKLTLESKFIKYGKEFFKTGTMGFIDEEGYFTITGRQSRFYIMSSLNKVYCDHIQSVMSAIGCIKDIAIVKVPDNEKLFVNKAYIVLNEDYSIEESKNLINKKCFEPILLANGEVVQLKEYEVPSYIEYVQTLPRKQGTEKIDYAVLEEDAKSSLLNQKKLTYEKH